MDINGHTPLCEDYVSFETAKLLKEKGFESDYCHTAYDCKGEFFWHGDYSKDRKGIMDAPTLQMTMKWLREVHNRYIEICIDNSHNFKDIVFRPAIYDKELDCLWESDNFLTYEEACEAGIKYCLENLI